LHEYFAPFHDTPELSPHFQVFLERRETHVLQFLQLVQLAAPLEEDRLLLLNELFL
jgi:hypothetical protein